MAEAKTIHGQPLDQTTFKRTIVEALAAMENGTGTVADLLPAVGPEWDTAAGRKLLSKTLMNLARSGTLKRDPDLRGAYTVSAGFKRRGVSVRDQNEQSIVDSIRKRGGFAKFSEIMDDFGLRPHGEDLREMRGWRTRQQYGTEKPEDVFRPFDVQNTTAYHQLRAILATSEIIRQDFMWDGGWGATTGGYYNLPLDELNKMPLRGQFAGLIAKATHDDLQLRGSYMTERDALFSRVGSVFNTARRARRWSSENFVSRKRVAAAMLDLARNPVIARENRDHHRAETEAEIAKLEARGAGAEEIAAYRAERDNRRDIDRRINMLNRFEKGGEGLVGVNMHMNAPVSFYEALGAELGIDPVGASRGFLQPGTRGDRIRLHRPQPDMQRIVEIELYRERQREGQPARVYGFDEDDASKPR